jgi:hypothetical protein
MRNNAQKTDVCDVPVLDGHVRSYLRGEGPVVFTLSFYLDRMIHVGSGTRLQGYLRHR